MKFYSTNNSNHRVSLADAIMKSLPEDNGLYMPESIPVLPHSFFENIQHYTFAEIGFEIAKHFLHPDLSLSEIKNITDDAINFPVPLVQLDDQTFILELFHGPTLAFKDVGARFMSRTMALLNKNENKKLTILVATSGDTGSAVANGFYDVDGIEVIILYPSGKVSPLQEKQLTTLGKNITALEIKGTFDDCQRLVKQSFLDQQLNSYYRLSSANSINIARLIPQSFYYVDAYRQLKDKSIPFYYSVPSGNFGNLTAGLIAKKMGLPVSGFIAATNANNTIPNYLKTGNYSAQETIATISNAMDVGNPSNYARMNDFYKSHLAMGEDIVGYAYSDEATRKMMVDTYQNNNYVLDPHGAVGLLGWKEFSEGKNNIQGIILETAHPTKFIDVVTDTLHITPELPPALKAIEHAQKQSVMMENDFSVLKNYLLSR
ncbi:MAG: threonine synthase [Bacteroidota bacterium]|jgi:threonine synthase